MFGIGKRYALKKLGIASLDKLGSNDALDDIILEASKFIAACYGCPDDTDMTSVRSNSWKNKTGPKSKLNNPGKI